ncbi:MAG: putative PEP-CTERM system TPR-repeat lipoprotein [Glaciecola sp.]|jgi:putative PEP-CTERM system TPR-repeat lipoprotein
MLLKFSVFLFLASVSLAAYTQQLSDYEKANKSFNEGLVDESYIHLKNSLNDNPDHLPSKILMGYVLGISGYYDEAELELKEALQNGADINLVVEPLVNVLLALSKYEDIIEISERQLTPAKKAFLLSSKGIALNNQGNVEASSKAFKAALELTPKSISAINSYANFLIEQNELEKAESYINTSLELDDTISNTYLLQSFIFKKLNNPAQEIQALKKTIELAGTHPLALRELVSVLTRENRFEEAKLVLQKTLKLTPSDPVGQLLLSWVASNLDDDELTAKTLSELVNNLSLLDSEELSNNEELLYIDGMANYASNNLEAAKKSLNQYLFKRPGNRQAANILVDIYKAEGNYTGAISILEKYESSVDTDLALAMRLCDLYISASLNHKCAWLLTRLEPNYKNEDSYIEMSARLLAARGKLDLALGKLEEINTSSLSTVLQKAILSIRAEKYNDANTHIDLLLTTYPNSPGVLNLKATVLLKTNRSEEAETLFKKVIRENPSHFESKFNLARQLFGERRSAEALPLVESLYASRPDSVEVLTLYGRILKQIGKSEQAMDILQNASSRAPRNIEIKEALIDLYISNGNNERALAIINTLLKDDFLNARYMYKRGLIYTNLDQTAKAKEDFQTLLGLYSDSIPDLYRLSLAQARISDTEGALKTVNRILEIESSNFFARRDRVRILLASGNTAEARLELSQLKQEYPKNPDINLLMGDLLASQNDFTAAAALYVDAIKSQNLLAPALIRSYQLAIEGHGEGVFVKQFEALAKDYERNTFSTNLLADYYLTMGETTKAKPLYLSLAESTGYVGRPLVLNNLANLYIKEGKVDAAYNFAQQAYELLPGNQAILDTFGWVLTLRGDFENALDLLRRSYSMNSSDAGVRYHIAYTLMKLNRLEEALEATNILLSEFGDFNDREKAEELKQQLISL